MTARTRPVRAVASILAQRRRPATVGMPRQEVLAALPERGTNAATEWLRDGEGA